MSSYKSIINYLHHASEFSSRVIGGSIRRTLLKHLDKSIDSIVLEDSEDIDIATTLLPNEVINILSKYNVKVIPTGIKFGTVTAFLYDQKFEITTLRRDTICDGRHAKVVFTKSFEEDAMRRDFTINAISYCPINNEIYDYFNGIEDLKNSKVIFIGDPKKRIKEDYLRILRFFRFSCDNAKSIDNDGLRACIECKNGLNKLSKERIKLEIDKIIESKKSPAILKIIINSGIMQLILPVRIESVDVFSRAIQIATDMLINLNSCTRYAILLYNDNLPLFINSLLKLAFSKKEAIKIVNLLNFLQQLKHQDDWYFLMKKVWLKHDNYDQYLIVSIAYGLVSNEEANKFLTKYNNQKPPKFMINGHDILHIYPKIDKKQIAKVLLLLQDKWIASDFMMTKDELVICAINLKVYNT